jgi:hypothetical protein
VAPKKKNRPKYTDKEGNMTLAIFKNKNKKTGKPFILTQITSIKFPFVLTQTLTISEPEIERLKILLERKPVIELKGK